MNQKGIVYKTTGLWHTVKNEQNKFIECRIRGKLKIKDYESTNPIAVGDIVYYEEIEDGTGIIYDIEERKNCIIRQSTNLSKQIHIIACNVDQAMLIVSLREPETPIEFIDRFLVSCEIYKVTPIVVFNKVDLYTEEDLNLLDELMETYEKIGYETFWTSVAKKINLDKTINILKNKTTVIAGNSGVGKSSLINAISPNLNIKTDEISKKYKTGKHTTTFAQMYDLSFGGKIIDTPGIKAFGLAFVEKQIIAQNFPEMFNLLGSCRYNNCLHIDEPGCAVKEAFERGEISYTRYKSYVNIILDENSKYRPEF